VEMGVTAGPLYRAGRALPPALAPGQPVCMMLARHGPPAGLRCAGFPWPASPATAGTTAGDRQPGARCNR
jgi:hypothetical protein